jgi:hypothetical protein
MDADIRGIHPRPSAFIGGFIALSIKRASPFCNTVQE